MCCPEESGGTSVPRNLFLCHCTCTFLTCVCLLVFLSFPRMYCLVVLNGDLRFENNLTAEHTQLPFPGNNYMIGKHGWPFNKLLLLLVDFQIANLILFLIHFVSGISFQWLMNKLYASCIICGFHQHNLFILIMTLFNINNN